LAPFRGMLQEFSLLKKDQKQEDPKIAVFFGCRYEQKDFHFKDDLKRWEAEKLIKLFCAFSRDQEDKNYVQHLIEKEGSFLKNLLIDQSGRFFVSGSSKNMPEAVREVLEKALENKSFVEEMIKLGKYQEETWS
jgi:sulfite reductase alpha subunit-like flavoprotein